MDLRAADILRSIAREEREPQIRMVNAVEIAINTDQHAIIEAGTGTGKSFGYLIPAIKSGKTVVISTANIALQQQLYESDLPFLSQALYEKHGIRFRYGLLKGRGNFMCQKERDESRGNLFDSDEVIQWADRTETGDRAEIDFPVSPRDWGAIKSDRETCTGQKCPYRGEWDESSKTYTNVECHYYRARESMKGAQIIVTNHAMVALDLRLGGVIIGEYDVLILDEAHQFEQYVLNAWNGELRKGTVKALVEKLEEEFEDFKLGKELTDAFEGIFKAIAKVAPDGQDKYRLSVVDLRDQAWSMVMLLERVEQFIMQRASRDNEGQQALVEKLGMLNDILLSMTNPYDSNKIAWAEHFEDYHGNKQVKIMNGPIAVGGILKAALFEGEFRRPTVLTSATISTGGDFRFLSGALGVEADLTMMADSPFDYENNTLLYVPMHLDPQQARTGFWQAYENDLHNEIMNLVGLSHGSAFCLFTSNRAMNRAYEILGYEMEKIGLPTIKQGDMDKGKIIEWFKLTPNAVLFATQSFWEGVSIEGDALKLVVIDKIPFPGPGDPQRDAKADKLKARGGNSFIDMDLPEAIIKIKQGFGRLIRTQTDRGMVAILDNRIHTKRYGKTILRSLPPAKFITDLKGVDLTPYFGVPVSAFEATEETFDPDEIPF